MWCVQLKGIIVFSLICSLFVTEVDGGVNGAHTCAGCTFAVGIFEQFAQVHNSSINDTLNTVCSLFPTPEYRKECRNIIATFGPVIAQLLYEKATPDVVCNALRLCYVDPGQRQCHLFPLPKEHMLQGDFNKHVFSHQHTVKKHMSMAPERVNSTFVCSLPGIKFLCKLIDGFTQGKKPLYDLDGDGFSTLETLRGTSWRGRDCLDIRGDVHPGANPFESDVEYDANCNGIYGVDDQGRSYEKMLCPDNLTTRGVAVIGDSAMAHFHIPYQWVTPALLNKEILTHLPFVVENEFDWPMMSASTGYMNITWPIAGGTTHSLYSNLKERNRCIHRDYQNIAVNGANIFWTQEYQRALMRNNTGDRPLVIVFGLVGNDVCNDAPDTVANMTTQAEMRENILKSMEYLNSVVPADSKILLIGLADGRPLFDSLHERFHPIGQLNKNVKYPDFYEFLDCLEITPCHGWMTTNATLRDITSERARNLSQVLFDVAREYRHKFSNIEINFIPCPFNTVIDEWVIKHGPETVYQLIEPVDGFHPNQIAQDLIAQYAYSYLQQNLPHYLGDINPNNEQIHEIFGDQGGY